MKRTHLAKYNIVRKQVNNIKKVVIALDQRTNWMPLIASVGIGAVAYQMMKPNNRMTNAVRNRMGQMWRQRELFPNR
ncbi:hypothetical protein [Scopulibacillus cellulosilyticus]|uniref:DUF3918 domain-containing protein n=1 Tax=Scopulibacillus cellulosilyticus TaxID=2665665 RepID=A0ABW2Q1V5_9BACL